MAKVVFTIRSFADGTVMVQSIPSLEAIAARVRDDRSEASGAEVYALRIGNHLTEYEKRRRVIAGTGETLVVLQVEDRAGGGVAVFSDPKAEDIYRRHRDGVTQLSQAETFALEAFSAVFAMSKAAHHNITPTKG